jgi:F-type H+-transporting ATPase subunit delta
MIKNKLFNIKMAFGKSLVQVSTQTVEGKYANALFRAAMTHGTFKQTESDVIRLKANLDQKESKVGQMLTSPLMSNSQKEKLVKALVPHLDQSKTIRNFVDVVAANGRLSKIPDILDSFLDICQTEKDISFVTITSAKVYVIFINLK